MDRQIVFPGAIPLDTDLLGVQRNMMVALGALARAVLGTGPVVDGLACTPTVPASMSVSVGPGSISVLSVVDTLAFGSLPADTSDPLVKMGVNLAPVTFTLTAPTASGQAVNYLIQASLSEADATPVVLPYYNAADPSQPYSGPGNTGVAQNTQRLQRVQLQMKSGAPASVGAQATPPVDNGWVGVWVVTVNYGDTVVRPAAIQPFPAAPVLPFKLPQLAPGFSRIQVFTTSSGWAVPQGVVRARVRVVGGGGGGAGSTAAQAGGGGGAGGYAEGIVSLVPGQTVPVAVGVGGAGGAAGASGVAGGTSSFGTMISATGGLGGVFSASSPAGAIGGLGSGGQINLPGGQGTDGQPNGNGWGGNGGASAFGGGGRGFDGGTPNVSLPPGAGGGAPYGGTVGAGGSGGTGIVIVEY